MAEVEFSPASMQKILAIYDYIADDLASPQAAQNTIDKFLTSVERLEVYPESGSRLLYLHEGIPDRFADTRLLISGNYVAVYNFHEDKVRIIQIYHGSEDYIHHLLRQTF